MICDVAYPAQDIHFLARNLTAPFWCKQGLKLCIFHRSSPKRNSVKQRSVVSFQDVVKMQHFRNVQRVCRMPGSTLAQHDVWCSFDSRTVTRLQCPVQAQGVMSKPQCFSKRCTSWNETAWTSQEKEIGSHILFTYWKRFSSFTVFYPLDKENQGSSSFVDCVRRFHWQNDLHGLIQRGLTFFRKIVFIQQCPANLETMRRHLNQCDDLSRCKFHVCFFLFDEVQIRFALDTVSKARLSFTQSFLFVSVLYLILIFDLQQPWRHEKKPARKDWNPTVKHLGKETSLVLSPTAVVALGQVFWLYSKHLVKHDCSPLGLKSHQQLHSTVQQLLDD